ncbi:MAG: phage holin family protein [Armatimonadetes bacterium]|nr:MAG: phage holin family protein [Armatimonadota bacterium]
MKILIRLAINAAAAWLAFTVLDGLHWDREWLTLAIIALIIGVVNTFIKPVLKFLSIPIRFVTLGLFTLVINIALMAGVIYLADSMDLGVTSDGWQWTLAGGLVIAIVSSVLSTVLD